MSIRRVVPDLSSERLDESRAFYVDVLGFEVAMDLGSVVTLASPANPTAQITLMRCDGSRRLRPSGDDRVADVDAVLLRGGSARRARPLPADRRELGVRGSSCSTPTTSSSTSCPPSGPRRPLTEARRTVACAAASRRYITSRRRPRRRDSRVVPAIRPQSSAASPAPRGPTSRLRPRRGPGWRTPRASCSTRS